MKKKLVTILVVIVLVLALGVAGALGFVWYRDNHVFVEGDAYPIDSTSLDLTEKDITFYYYDQLKSLLPECSIVWNVPFQDTKVPSDTQVLTVSNLSEEDIPVILKYFPNLKTLDATSGDSMFPYQNLEALMEIWPEGQVLYEVDLGGKRVEPDATELVLTNEEYDFATLMQNLRYLRQLTSLKLRTPALTTEQIGEIEAAFPEVNVTCTAEIYQAEYDTDTTELDLSGMPSSDVAAVAEQLQRLPNLTYVDLMGEAEESQLSKADVKMLMEAAPNVVFNYAFDFYGERLSTADTEVIVKNKKIGDEGEQEICDTLDLLTNCDRFVLEYCQVSYDILAQIRDDYRGRTKVVWRVEFGGGHTLTDAEVIRCTYDLVDDNCANLYYCEDVRFVDFGHNEWLDGCDFISGMVNLEYCILSGAPIKSLEPFANCKKLKFLEVAFCEYIESVEPLRNCTQLEKLNISNTHVVDLTPLDELPLTHFVAMEINAGKSRVPVEEQNRFVSQHPDSWTQFEGKQPYDEGWRRDVDGKTSLPHYAAIQIAFRYPHAPNNTGWYLSEENLSEIAALHPMVAEAVTEETQPAETIPEETIPEETISETTAVE